MDHLAGDLIAYLTDELPPAERERVEAHLAACGECRDQRDDFRGILAELRSTAPALPDLHWGRWRAELRGRLEARHTRRSWWRHPVPAALATGLAAALVAAIWLSGPRETPRTDLVAWEEVVLGEDLDFFRQYSLLERLDLLEDLEVIDHLDRLAPSADG